MPAQVIVIVGPTCSGKTQLAIQWAKRLGCDIINFDSRQVYQELNLGVARPSTEELREVPHHLIASHSIFEPLNAHSFSELARTCTQKCLERTQNVVLVGGTGLYLSAYLHGLDALPKVSTETRNEVMQLYENQGISGLAYRLYELDQEAFDWVPKDNPARLMRALEICLSSGLSLRESRKKEGSPLPYEYHIFGIETHRNSLYEAINQRVFTMIHAGFEQEVRELTAHEHLWPLKTVGYTEFFAYLKGSISKERAITLMQQKTRNYAKRQITWFKHQIEAQWFPLNHLLELPTEHIL